jgi:two-component system NtrC family sensor kinase
LRDKDSSKERSQRAIELLGSAIDVKINELTENNRQLKRKIFDLYTIFELSRNLNAVLDYHTLVDSFLLTSLGQVGASSSALYLPQGSTASKFTLVLSKGISDDQTARAEIAADGRLATYLKAVMKPVSVRELADRFSDSSEFDFLSVFQNGLVIPLIIKAQLSGLLTMGQKVSGGGFGADDIEFLSILADQFAVALENARLYESERNALQELRKAQKQLVVTERHAAVGELSAKIAHEINNPLSIISNYMLLIQRNLENPETAARHVEVAREELSRIARIVRQLLDFHRPRATEKASVDLPRLVNSVLALMEWQLAERKIEVQREIAAEVPKIFGAEEMLKQVLLNLIINARDAMPDGGILTIGVASRDSMLQLRVSDTGSGIPQEHLSRIFEPFFTTKDGFAGTGLGLSVCYGIVREHGGHITAGNDSRGGAVFEITLPVQSDNFGNV